MKFYNAFHPTHLVGVRALDQPREVRHGERHGVRELDPPDRRVQRRERVGRHLGPGPREPAQQRGLARVGVAHETHVGDGLELELVVPPLPLVARRAEGPRRARRLAGAPGLDGVAQPGPPALGRRVEGHGLVEVGHLHAVEEGRAVLLSGFGSVGATLGLHGRFCSCTPARTYLTHDAADILHHGAEGHADEGVRPAGPALGVGVAVGPVLAWNVGLFIYVKGCGQIYGLGMLVYTV